MQMGIKSYFTVQDRFVRIARVYDDYAVEMCALRAFERDGFHFDEFVLKEPVLFLDLLEASMLSWQRMSQTWCFCCC